MHTIPPHSLKHYTCQNIKKAKAVKNKDIIWEGWIPATHLFPMKDTVPLEIRPFISWLTKYQKNISKMLKFGDIYY